VNDEELHDIKAAYDDRENSIFLEMRNVAVTYSNGAKGLSSIDMTVHAGEIVAVLGRNGAGKTTLLHSIGGFLRSEHVKVNGEILLDAENLAGMPPMKTYRRGVVLVPEREKVFTQLTVEEHLRLVSGSKASTVPPVSEAIHRLRKSKAGVLSGGERQMLALEVAWRSEPRLLLVDEVSLGLAPVIVKNVLEQLKTMALERQISVIVVEQDAVEALKIADTVYVLNQGEVVWQGPSAETSAGEIGRQYLGLTR
jgi:ABC-type branched-subunit amino acid transport system ATPase component